MSVAWVGVGVAAGSAILGSQAAGKAADAQAKSAADSTAAQKEMFDKQVQLQEPFRQTGLAANNALAYRLGLPGATAPGAATPGAFSGGGSADMAVPTTYMPGQTNDPVWEKVLGDFNQAHQARYGTGMNRAWNSDADAQATYQQLAEQYRQAKGAEQTAAAPAAATDPNSDPTYGSLMRNFTTADMNADPVYQSGLQFGLDEGTKGINRQAAATGSSLSGATLKALTRFGTDYGSTKANDSFNRFNVNRDSTYNKLAGVSGAGQQAINQVTSAAGTYGTNVGNNITSAGNARAAGYIGGANAISNGVGQAVNGYQNNLLMNRIFPGGGTSGSGYSGASSFGGGGLMDELKSQGVF